MSYFLPSLPNSSSPKRQRHATSLRSTPPPLHPPPGNVKSLSKRSPSPSASSPSSSAHFYRKRVSSSLSLRSIRGSSTFLIPAASYKMFRLVLFSHTSSSHLLRQCLISCHYLLLVYVPTHSSVSSQKYCITLKPFLNSCEINMSHLSNVKVGSGHHIRLLCYD